MSKRTTALVIAGILATAPTVALADGASDLATCQATVSSASADLVQTLTDRVERCLRKVSAAVIADGASTGEAATGAAEKCVALFRGLKNSNRPRKQADEVFDTTVGAACDPAVNPLLLHAEADTWTIGARTLGAGGLASSCAHFGRGGSIASFAAWRDCLRTATACQAHQAVALRWPRALEYFAALKTAIAALPADAARDDALAALTAVDAAIEGPIDDDVPDVDCVAQAGVLETGQTNCVKIQPGETAYSRACPNGRPGEDAFFHAGVPLQYADNGDGTVTDLVTGLMWEKLDRAGGVHDVEFADDWDAATSAKIGQLNGGTFAGHDDWRVPNRRELESIVKFDAVEQGPGVVGPPVVNDVFDTACTPGCSTSTCSCTSTDPYWSSSVYQADANQRWTVSFGAGDILPADKATGSYRLRAVRGGFVPPVEAKAATDVVSAVADTAGTQLQACQLAASSASSKYVRAATRAVGSCLNAMSAAVVQGGVTLTQAATSSAELCTLSLRRLRNSNDPGKELAATAAATIATSCDPAVNPALLHDPADVWGAGPSSLGAAALAESCAGLVPGEAITSVAGWSDCLLAASDCQVRQSIALRWPRALEYMAALKTAIGALPPTPATADALAALGALDTALEGGIEDDLPDVQCGAPRGVAATGQTECDQGDGTLGACSGSDSRQDGQVRAGRPRRFVDNGDGTISDLVTGLMWEKQDGSASGSGTDLAYSFWGTALSLMRPAPPSQPFLRQGLAGYADWRLPNRRELESLVDLGGQSPAIDPVFHHDCTPGCSLDTCACTVAGPYWSSTHAIPSFGNRLFPAIWTVSFTDGSVFPIQSSFGGEATANARMVRGGTTDPLVVPGPPIAGYVYVTNPWRSSCVPVQVVGYDVDSLCPMRERIVTFPSNGFLTEFILPEAAPVSAPDTCDLLNNRMIEAPPHHRFAHTLCYVPFSPTFTGLDTFTYVVIDSDGNESAPATADIDIFEIL